MSFRGSVRPVWMAVNNTQIGDVTHWKQYLHKRVGKFPKRRYQRW